MSKYQTEIEDLIWEYNTSGKDLETAMLHEIGHVYSQATKADEYEANLKEVKKQLKIKIRHARRDGDYSESYAFSEALDMIENSI